jgi:MoaA/NifB/PqqE/SkfB family radical SAM enzyme
MCECGAREVSTPPRRMARALAEAVLIERAGTPLREVIPSTMGEPLLWPGMDALVGRCAAQGLRLNLTTNGTFPIHGAREWTERLVPILSDVKVSMNGATAETAAAVMTGVRHDAVIENVRTLVAVRDRQAAEGGPRASVSFQVTAQEANVAELAAIVRLAAALGVDRVKLNHLQVRRPDLADRSLRRSPAAIMRWNAAAAEARAAAAHTPRAGGGRVALENALALVPDPVAPAPLGPCPFLGREAWLHHDGRFAPCPSPRAAELGAFGSVARAPLGSIWEGDAFRALVAEWPKGDACGGCSFRRVGGA